MRTRIVVKRDRALVAGVVISVAACLSAAEARGQPSVGSMAEKSLDLANKLYVEPLNLGSPLIRVAIGPFKKTDSLVAVHVTIEHGDGPADIGRESTLEVTMHFVNGHLTFIDVNGWQSVPSREIDPEVIEARESASLAVIADAMSCRSFALQRQRILPDGSIVRGYRSDTPTCRAAMVEIVIATGIVVHAGVP